ncbi:MAG: NAD(P)/FAD-dependent oxidoreductase, partial [Candidatus Riflebacteria bacterium]|nr:NAD(P)/FAD-dependent oxidoreductase [Candidatus Riflebacteria bacterium]
DPKTTDRVLLCRQRVSRIFYNRKFFDYPIKLNFRTIFNLGIKNTFVFGISYLNSLLRKLPETSLENFYINRFGRKIYEAFFESYTEKVWGKHPSELSADWGAQRVKGLSILKLLTTALTKPFIKNQKVETSLIESYIYPKFGPGQYWETMAEEIKKLGGEIILNAEVSEVNTAVEKGKHLIKSVAFSQNGSKKVVSGDYYISSMPIKDLIQAMPAETPENVKEIAGGLPYRDFITVGLLVNKLKIKNTTNRKTLGDIVPDCWIYIQEREVKLGRLQIFNNWSPYMLKDPEHNVWIGLEYFCNEGDKMWNTPEDEFIKFAIYELDKIGIIDKNDVLDSVRIKMKKAYPAYFGTYDRFSEVQDYLESFNNLYCVGRNGQHRYNNMDHSMMTSVEAVKAICGETDKSIIWKVNTEKDYHEAGNKN